MDVTEDTGPYDGVGIEPDIEEDSSGNLHIAYRDGTLGGGQLYYATDSTGVWVVEELNFSETSGVAQFKLGLDKNQNPYIAYNRGNSVGFLTSESGSWSAETIETRPPADILRGRISLQTDSEGTIHALYYVSNGTTLLRYAKRVQGSWVAVTVAENGESFGSYSDLTTSLFVDESLNAHIGHTDRNGDLQYITNESGSWTTTYLASSTDEHRWTQKDYAVLPGGIFHMVFSSAVCIPVSVCFDTG
ncbi:MAG: hypothetical protein AAGI44_03420, partial [Pseudomonadota bacterium]